MMHGQVAKVRLRNGQRSMSVPGVELVPLLDGDLGDQAALRRPTERFRHLEPLAQ